MKTDYEGLRVLYVAKHGSGGNDDEVSIGESLEGLGCLVQRVQEHELYSVMKSNAVKPHDLVLTHKCHEHGLIARLKSPKAFWYFDLVDYPEDPSLARRCATRKEWLRRAGEVYDFGFMTDGNYVFENPKRSRKAELVHLCQGFDPKQAGVSTEMDSVEKDLGVLFVGGVDNCGEGRREFVGLMRREFGQEFLNVKAGLYGADLTRFVRRHRVVVCPPTPVYDSYWSNRIYQMCGRGAFVLHPMCHGLIDQYADAHEIMYYSNPDQLVSLCRRYLNDEESQVREEIGTEATRKTLEEHTYRHRVEDLLGRVFSGGKGSES